MEELRKRYRELLRKYHPDNKNGNTEITQQINKEYDSLFAILSKENKSAEETYTHDENEGNKAFKEVLNSIIHINSDMEIVGLRVWVHGGYEFGNCSNLLALIMLQRKNAGAGTMGNIIAITSRKSICLTSE